MVSVGLGLWPPGGRAGGRVDGWTGGRPVEPSGSTAQFIAARLNLSQVDQ